MEFNFPENCTYCKTFIGAKHCLLPFNFVYEYTKTIDGIVSLMEISRIHSEYGDPNLILNFNFLLSQASKPTPEQNVEFASQASSVVSDRRYFLPSIDRSNDPSLSASETGVKIPESTSPEPLTAKPVILQQIDVVLESTKPESKDPELSETTSHKLDWSDESIKSAQINKPIPMSFKPTQPEMQKPAPEPQRPRSLSVNLNAVQDPKDPLFGFSADHVAKDVTTAILGAYLLDKNNLLSLPMSDLGVSIDKEIETVMQFGEKYKRHTDLNLNNPIAIAKELIGNHDYGEILDWSEGTNLQCHNHCCLFQFQKTGPALKSDSQSLAVELFTYAKGVESNPNLSQLQVGTVQQCVKRNLERRKSMDAYTWFNERSTTTMKRKSTKLTGFRSYFRERRPAPKEHKPPSSYKSQTKSDSEDELLQDLELPKSEVKAIIYGIISENKDKLFSGFPTGEIAKMTNLELITKLFTQFIQMNKNWRNPLLLSSDRAVSRLFHGLGIPEPTIWNKNILSVLKLLQPLVAEQFSKS